MEIQLTEEVSRDLHEQFSKYLPLAVSVSEHAIEKMKQYYAEYLLSKKYWFRPMSEEKFYSALVGTQVSVKNYYPYAYTYNPYPIGISYIDIHRKYGVIIQSSDITLIETAIRDGNIAWSDEYEEVKDFIDIISNYLTTPYKVDSKILKLYEKVKAENENRITILNNCWVEHDF